MARNPDADASTLTPHHIGDGAEGDELTRTIRNIQAIRKVTAARIDNQGPQRGYLFNGVLPVPWPPSLKLHQSLLIRQGRLQKHIHRQQCRWWNTGGMVPDAVFAKMPFSRGRQDAACYGGIRFTRLVGNVVLLMEDYPVHLTADVKALLLHFGGWACLVQGCRLSLVICVQKPDDHV